MRWLQPVALLITSMLITGFVVAVFLVFQEPLDEIERQLEPAQQLEPYGGCDEAYLYPDTEGARWCAERGLP